MLIRPTAIACALLATSAAAQSPPTLVRLEPGTCPTCTVTLEKVAVIGRATDKELIPDYARLLQLRDGGFVVAGTGRTATPLLRYGRDGHYIGTVGKLGEGPGEYRSIQSLVRARGDSISLMGDRRITTIAVATGRGRTEPIPFEAFYHTVLGDGRVVVNTMAQKDPSFALLGDRSAIVARFGAVQPPVVLPRQGGRTIGDPYATWVSMVPSPTGGFWAGNIYYSHRLQKLTATGKVLIDLQRKPPWFVPYAYADIDEKVYRLGELRTPRPAIMNAIGADPAGYLLTLSRVADAKWKADPKAPAPHPPGGEYPTENLLPTGGIDRYVDTIIEVYRDADGALLGSWRSDLMLGQMIANGLIYLRGEDTDGVVSYTIYRVKVTGAK